MTEAEIEAFLTITESGSISAASELLHISQPALSRRVQAMEEELGYAVFVRGKGVRGVTLTPRGEAFVPLAHEWQKTMRDALAIRNLESKKTLRVGAIGSVCSYLMPNVLKQLFEEGAPYNLEFHNYHSDEAYAAIERGALDLAFIDYARKGENGLHSDVVTRPYFAQKFVMIGSDAWPGNAPVYPKDLDPHKEIRLPWNVEFDLWHRDWFDANVYPRVWMDHIALLPEILKGDSFCIVPAMMAKLISGNGRNVHPLKNGPADEIIYRLTAAEGEKEEELQHFLDLLGKEIALHSELVLLG